MDFGGPKNVSDRISTLVSGGMELGAFDQNVTGRIVEKLVADR
jgi:hypothetical protein